MRKQVDAIDQSPEFTQLLFEVAADGILLVDAQGQIARVNRRIETLFLYQREDLIGQNIHILMPKRFARNHQALFERFREQPHQRQMGHGLNLTGLRADGTEFPVEISLSPLYTQGVFLVMAFITDTSERKQTEQAKLDAELLKMELQRNRDMREMKNRFMSMFVHDFRSPLSFIMTNVSLLDRYTERFTREEQQNKVQRIYQQIKLLDQMLDEILEMTRSETGNRILNPETFDLELFCQEILYMHQDDIGNKYQFVFAPSGDLSAVKLDKTLMHYVLTNLISNAIKYSPYGGMIHFSVQSDDEQVVFVVRDQGIGIPAEEIPLLFDPFHRASNVGELRGTGLGLSIVKEYVEMHGGAVNCESVLGEGTTFSVHIPQPLS